MKASKSKTLTSETPLKHELFNIAEVQVSYNPAYKMSERPKISGSHDTEQLLRQVWNKDNLQYIEQFYLILMSRSHAVLGIYPVSKGGVSGTIADPKVIFSVALKGNCSSLIIAHNHPSGSLQPSEADINLTKKIIAGGKILDIQVLDHIILTAEGYTSFADQDWLS